MRLRITENDIKIFQFLHRFRVLNSHHLATLTGRDKHVRFRKRLAQLTQAGYIDRPPAQRYIFTNQKGGYPLVYALGRLGAEQLQQQGYDITASFWKDKNKKIKPLSLEHSLYHSDYLVALHKLCTDTGKARIIWKDEILKQASVETRAKPKPFTWETEFYFRGQHVRANIEPDDFFGLEIFGLDKRKNKKCFFLEIDTGSMAISRADVHQSSILKKFYSYADTHNRQLAKRAFGIKNFRVLFVTSTAKRADNMKACFAQYIEGKAPDTLFIFDHRNMANRTALEGELRT